MISWRYAATSSAWRRKIDEKPSRWVMFTALAVTVLGMVAAVGGALAVLDALGS